MEWITFLTPYPTWIKLLLAGGVACWGVAGIGMLFTSLPKAVAIETSGPGTVNVTSHSQHGGITANIVNTKKQ